MSEEVISGIIEGEEKDLDVLNEYMLSTVSSIKEELLMKYPQEISEFYVYNKYNEKDRILKIFVTLLKETKLTEGVVPLPRRRVGTDRRIVLARPHRRRGRRLLSRPHR